MAMGPSSNRQLLDLNTFRASPGSLILRGALAAHPIPWTTYGAFSAHFWLHALVHYAQAALTRTSDKSNNSPSLKIKKRKHFMPVHRWTSQPGSPPLSPDSLSTLDSLPKSNLTRGFGRWAIGQHYEVCKSLHREYWYHWNGPVRDTWGYPRMAFTGSVISEVFLLVKTGWHLH